MPVLWVMVGALWVEGAAAVVQAHAGPLPAAVQWGLVGLEAPAAALFAWLTFRWGLLPARQVRLLVMLHAGFAWLAVTFGLAAASHALAAGADGGYSPIGLAPLHALTMGWFGALLVAMLTRVSAGHGGRPLVADRLAWTLYLLVHVAAALRVAVALAPTVALAEPLLLAGGVAWAVAAVAWAWRYGGWFGRPRPDGRPG